MTHDEVTAAMNAEGVDARLRQVVADQIMLHAIYEGREGDVLASAERDDAEYLHAWNAAGIALAAVLPDIQADLLTVLRLIDGEVSEADDINGLNADAVQRIGWYLDPIRARLTATTEEPT